MSFGDEREVKMHLETIIVLLRWMHADLHLSCLISLHCCSRSRKKSLISCTSGFLFFFFFFFVMQFLVVRVTCFDRSYFWKSVC